MSWFKAGKSVGNKQPGVTIALESISGEVLTTQLKELERELISAGFVVRRLEFPSQQAEVGATSLFKYPELLATPEAVGLASALDRVAVFYEAYKTQSESEIILLTGSQLATAAWLATLVREHRDRIGLYKWLDELEHKVFTQRRIDLTILLDHDPKHIDMQDAIVSPAGWLERTAPEIEILRNSYLEAAKLLPNTKIVACERAGLLRPDTEIHNEIWNLTRRIALKK